MWNKKRCSCFVSPHCVFVREIQFWNYLRPFFSIPFFSIVWTFNMMNVNARPIRKIVISSEMYSYLHWHPNFTQYNSKLELSCQLAFFSRWASNRLHSTNWWHLDQMCWTHLMPVHKMYKTKIIIKFCYLAHFTTNEFVNAKNNYRAFHFSVVRHVVWCEIKMSVLLCQSNSLMLNHSMQ